MGIVFDEKLNFDFVEEWGLFSWLFIIIAGLFTIFENTAKFMAKSSMSESWLSGTKRLPSFRS